MIIINTKEDASKHELPEFIVLRLFTLLSLYNTDSLKDFGPVEIVESKAEAASIPANNIEFTETIICEKQVWWNLSIPVNNSYCKEVYIEERHMTPSLLNECEENLIRTVHDSEILL